MIITSKQIWTEFRDKIKADRERLKKQMAQAKAAGNMNLWAELFQTVTHYSAVLYQAEYQIKTAE